jgi:BNR repeat-containing family member
MESQMGCFRVRPGLGLTALTYFGVFACAAAGGSSGAGAGAGGTSVGSAGTGGSKSVAGGAASGDLAGGAAFDAGGNAGSLLAGTSSDAAGAPGAGSGGAGDNGGAPGGGRTGGAGGNGGALGGGAGTILESIEIADVWSGQPVNFALVTHEDQQFVAFYDKDENMTVGSRVLGSKVWTLARLASKLGWDSHNFVAMAMDESGFLHVSGNMHVNPLVYFRSAKALDVTSLTRVTSMVGSNEQSCTYPQFFRGPAGNLIFAYRDGSSGDGNYIFNSYNAASKTWQRLLNTPLADGQGLRNAYPVGPSPGPDGFWHLVWVWRETPDAASNHDLSYARTHDLLTWQSASGRPLQLPITLASADIVDPVPEKGGMINNNTKVGFDTQQHAIVSYQKYDSNGNTQLYNARVENGVWVSHQTTDWTYRWAFSGSGSLVFEIEFEPVRVGGDGALYQDYYHVKYGHGTLRLDPTTLHAAATLPAQLPYPASLDVPQSSTAGMVTRWADDSGASPDASIRYMLRWETLPTNRDLPRSTIPPATPLRLYAFRR